MVQIWDKDFFSPNDNISEAIIPLQPFLRYCEKFSKDKRCVLTYNEVEDFWIDLKAKGICILTKKYLHFISCQFAWLQVVGRFVCRWSCFR